MVLYLHGWGESIDSLHVRRLAHGLNLAAFTVIAFDLDMHGLSMGHYNAWPAAIVAHCRSNISPLTRASSHAVELAAIAATEAHGKGLVVVGHSLGAGIAMLAIERIKAALPHVLRGTVLIAPANHADCEVFGLQRLRWWCCPCIYCCATCLCQCPCCTVSREAWAHRQSVPGEPSYGARRSWLAPCCLYYLPPSWGGLPDAEWWRHHSDVSYTMVRNEADKIIMPQTVPMLRDAAPHGALELFEGAGHDFLVDVDENGTDVDWRRWLGRTVGLVQRMLTHNQ